MKMAKEVDPCVRSRSESQSMLVWMRLLLTEAVMLDTLNASSAVSATVVLLNLPRLISDIGASKSSTS